MELNLSKVKAHSSLIFTNSVQFMRKVSRVPLTVPLKVPLTEYQFPLTENQFPLIKNKISYHV